MPRYFATFSDEGKRITSIVEHIHFEILSDGKIMPPIPEGFIEISESDQTLYMTNRYIRGADGKPTKKVITDEEIFASIKATKLAEIKMKLTETDYKFLKFVDGELSANEYAGTKEQRKNLRVAYNSIESASTLEEVNAVKY